MVIASSRPSPPAQATIAVRADEQAGQIGMGRAARSQHRRALLVPGPHAGYTEQPAEFATVLRKVLAGLATEHA